MAAIPLGVLLGFAGPFGSYPAFPPATRYGFWIGLTLAGVVAALTAAAVPPVGRIRGLAMRVVAIALVSAVPMTFVVAWTMSLVQPGRSFAPQQLPALFVAVAAIQLLIAFVTTILVPVEPAEAASSQPARSGMKADPPAFPTALLGRLPPPIGRDIIALETEDHYLRVHAAGGSALILMRMADAVDMLDPRLGAQVHRRWWVAEAAVAGLRREGQKMTLLLVDGREVPVGRTFAAAAMTRFGPPHRDHFPAPPPFAGTISGADGV